MSNPKFILFRDEGNISYGYWNGTLTQKYFKMKDEDEDKKISLNS